MSAFVEVALATLRHEQPQAYARLVAALGGLTLALHIGDESLDVHVTPHAAMVTTTVRDAGLGQRDVRFVATRAAIADLLEARDSLVSAIDRGAIDVMGSVQHVLAFLDALTAFWQGAVRAPSFPHLSLVFQQSIGHEARSA